jgi:hypothetical protein
MVGYFVTAWIWIYRLNIIYYRISTSAYLAGRGIFTTGMSKYIICNVIPSTSTAGGYV